jgi:hypothetical protein
VDDAGLRLQPYLRPSEQLLWTGQPDPSVHFTPADLYLIPFTVFWAGFSIFWIAVAAAGDAPVLFVLIGVPFLLIGLYITIGRFFVKARLKRRTAYGVTTDRVLVAIGERTLLDSPIKYEPMRLKRSRNGKHVTVVIGRTGPNWGHLDVTNSGMDFFDQFSGGGVGLYDVADGDGLTRALDRVRSA